MKIYHNTDCFINMSLEYWKNIHRLSEVSLEGIKCKFSPKDLKKFAIHKLEDPEYKCWLPIAKYAEEVKDEIIFSILYKNILISSENFGQYKVLEIYINSGDNILRNIDIKQGKRNYQKWL